jgi:hypothetical protein
MSGRGPGWESKGRGGCFSRFTLWYILCLIGVFTIPAVFIWLVEMIR